MVKQTEVYYVIESKGRGYLSNKHKDDTFTWNIDEAYFFITIELASNEFKEICMYHNIEGIYYIHKVEMVSTCCVKTFNAEITLTINEI